MYEFTEVISMSLILLLYSQEACEIYNEFLYLMYLLGY